MPLAQVCTCGSLLYKCSRVFWDFIIFLLFLCPCLFLSLPTHTHTSLKVSSNFLLSTHFSLCHSNILFISTLTQGKTCSLLSFLLTVTWFLEVQHLLNHGFAPIIHALWPFFISLKFVDSKFSGVSVVCSYELSKDTPCFMLSNEPSVSFWVSVSGEDNKPGNCVSHRQVCSEGCNELQV